MGRVSASSGTAVSVSGTLIPKGESAWAGSGLVRGKTTFHEDAPMLGMRIRGTDPLSLIAGKSGSPPQDNATHAPPLSWTDLYLSTPGMLLLPTGAGSASKFLLGRPYCP